MRRWELRDESLFGEFAMKIIIALVCVCAALLAACGGVADLGNETAAKPVATVPSPGEIAYPTNPAISTPPSSHWESMGGSAPEARDAHSAVWTGSRMIVWGGRRWTGSAYTYLTSGGLYSPATDVWQAMSNVNAPQGRVLHASVWTGQRMIVWGGANKDGLTSGNGSYDPATDSWTTISAVNAPTDRYMHVAVWTGSKMIVSGGLVESAIATKTGALYDPATDIWSKMADAPEECEEQAAVWTGSQMLVFGGLSNVPGAYCGSYAYDPAIDAWTELHPNNAPARRLAPTAVWTGSKMIGWGGYLKSDPLDPQNTGGAYDPMDSWQSLSMKDAPTARLSHTAVWTGQRMVIWGGFKSQCLNTGGEYDPATDAWIAMPTIAPVARAFHSAVWADNTMIVWGGFDGTQDLADGGIYHPAN